MGAGARSYADTGSSHAGCNNMTVFSKDIGRGIHAGCTKMAPGGVFVGSADLPMATRN